jgi:acetyl-CoA acetyltransferase
MTDAFICDAIRTPIGRYGGALATVRADDLGAIPMKALMTRNADVDWTAVDDVIYGCGCHGLAVATVGIRRELSLTSMWAGVGAW